jgi:hypothetical protein
MKKPFKILFLILTFWSCSKSEKKLFSVSEPNGHRNEFLDMAESTNISPITDSLSYYLSIAELVQAEKVIYKNFGNIYQNENFKANVILRIGSKTGRDYKFIIRTFKKDGGIIDSYELAKWIEQDKQFCFGHINEKLIINKDCEDEKDVMKILIDGRIVSSLKESNDKFETEFESNFKEELKELEEMEKLNERKKVELTGDELQCPCCDYFTLGKRSEYEICQICFWEDDGIDINNINIHSGPNHITLKQGRLNFAKYGACDSTMVKNVINESERKKFKFEKRKIK